VSEIEDAITRGLREMDASLGVEPDAEEETPAEPTAAEEQPRDEMGRFAAKEAELGEEQPLIAGRFRSHEELEKAYLALDSEFGRRNQEWGDLRKEMAALREAIPQPQPQSVPLTQDVVSWVDEQVAENPHGIAEWARQNDPSGVLYNRVLDAWYELAPRQASAFERQQELQHFQGMLAQQQAPLVEAAQQQKVTEAFLAVRAELPDIDKYAEQILAEAQANPELLAPLASGTAPDRERVIRNLYRLARSEEANTVASAVGQELAQRAEQAEAARQQAFVATGSATSDPEHKTPEERWLEEVFDPAAAPYYG